MDAPEVLPSLWATHFYALEADEIQVLHHTPSPCTLCLQKPVKPLLSTEVPRYNWRNTG